MVMYYMFKKNNKLNLKTPRKRKLSKFKYLIYLFIIYFVICYTFYLSMQNNKDTSNEKFILFLLEGGNIDELEEYKIPNLINKTVNYFLNIDFRYPKSILNATLFKEKSNEIVISTDDDYHELEELKEISSYIEDPNPIDVDNPIVYIYNSHQLENYDNTNLEIYGITPNVLMASYLLKEKLNKNGVSSIVEDTNLTEFLNINSWDYSKSYVASRLLILDKQSKYNSLKYFIDIHRDSINKSNSTVKINNKDYAKILFVVGLEHDNYKLNLNTANKVNSLFNKYYPNLSRGVLKKSGPGVNGIYNQDISENSMLIEVGGYENTIEEVFNTIDAIATILTKYVNGEE